MSEFFILAFIVAILLGIGFLYREKITRVKIGELIVCALLEIGLLIFLVVLGRRR